MGAMRSWWQKIKRPLSVIGVIAASILLIAMIVGIIGGYLFNWKGTGVGQKTLWDWLQLLIIPAVLAVGGYLFNYSTTRNERRLTIDNQQDAAIKEYIDKMSELLLEKSLRKSKTDDEVRMIARARTITVLSRLNGKRKGSVLQFLYESKLIVKGQSIISLEGADFSNTDLRDAYLNVWCEIQNTDYQASKSAKAKGALPTCRLNQIQKLCKLTLAATRA